jgi:hypothetical protein
MITSNEAKVLKVESREYPNSIAIAPGLTQIPCPESRREPPDDARVQNRGANGLAPVKDLGLEDELVFLKARRAYIQHFVHTTGATQLNVYFGDKVISFDEPDEFGFGESLAMQSTFRAGSATTWGAGYKWERVRPLLAQLIAEGVLQYVDALGRDPITGARLDGTRHSLLPLAPSPVAKTWFDCETITQELTGRALEVGYLEMVVPIFRVAHMAMDSEGRQVGEANVFPKALRVEVPTNWRTCIYSGSRFQTDVPMNVSALKSMRNDWAQMMAVLLRVRETYLMRFPKARAGWTVGHLERLSTVVLALPTYLMMRTENRVDNGQLHPALSCLFRVTDGLRLTMHQMLFVPIGEPALLPDTPMSSAEVFAYAERNYSFHSEHGVCAGPKTMIDEFLSVVIDGKTPRLPHTGRYDHAIQSALDDLDSAFDYAMYGLQNYATIFSAWPIMTRTYEELYAILNSWAGKGSVRVMRYRDHLDGQIKRMRTRTYLATEAWRKHRELAYGDMYWQCAAGQRAGGQNEPHSGKSLAQQLSTPVVSSDSVLALQLVDAIQNAFDVGPARNAVEIKQLANCLQNFFHKNQAIVRIACDTQQHLNELLGRSRPVRSFKAADIDIHNLLQQLEDRTLPYLLDEIQDLLDIDISIDQDVIQIINRTGDALTQGSIIQNQFDQCIAERITCNSAPTN